MQKTLNREQVAAVYHDLFVQQQVEHFKKIALSNVEQGKFVVDIGGGCGYFASAVAREFGVAT
jgi:protein-L-isoaspartate O-methyltransferase